MLDTPQALASPTKSEPVLRHLEHATSLAPNAGFNTILTESSSRSFQSALFQFEVVLSYGQITDPRIILQALNLYLVAHQQADGIKVFSEILNRFATNMSNETQAMYEASLAVLKATHADKVPVAKRPAWMKDAFALLEAAENRTGSKHPIPHWAAGLVYSDVPWFFFKKKQAIKHLLWLAERPETEPVYGFYREVYRRLARHCEATGQRMAARRWRKLSGYDGVEPHVPIMGWFTTGLEGTTMAPTPVLDEVVKDRVFSLYGFGFSDIHFVVSDDGSSLIAIDAGTQPRWLQAAHAFLLEARPDLPDIKAAFITHAHWDHIGGHAYLRRHNPDIAIYGRDNFRAVTERVLREHRYAFFRGQDFDPNWIRDYAPTHPISEAQGVRIGGTGFSLIPVTGGETEDAMLIHIPGLDCAFVGDVVMPWYGEPWVNEGFAATASDAMDQIVALDAKHILHGHHPLTALYGPETLGAYRDMHTWLVRATRGFVTHGYSAKDIIRLNLIPPQLADHPDAALAYVAARDNVIARVAQDMVGIWREDQTGQSPEGLDTITTIERARLLSDYLGYSETQTIRMLDRILKGGDHALALQFAVAAEHAFGPTVQITRAKQQAADALRSAAQFLDPFAFTVLSEMTDRPQPRMGGAPDSDSEESGQ